MLVTVDFPPIVSGISTAFYNIWKNLPHEGRVILAPQVKGSGTVDKDFGRKIYRLPMPLGDNIFKKAGRWICLLLYCLGIVGRERIELLVCGQPVTIGAIGLLFKKAFRIPYQVWVYGGEIVKFRNNRPVFSLLRRVLDEAQILIANSGFTRNVYVEFGIPSEKIVVVTPAVDTERFKPGISVEELVLKYGLHGRKRILTVARLSERKGHDMVIGALGRIRESFPDIAYLIVGSGPDEKRLRKMAGDYHVEKNVIFTGAVVEEDLPRYYNLCDIYVMPNREVGGIDTLEGFGISFIEASACAKPVIGGRSGGSVEAVSDGETGYLVEPLDVAGFAMKIMELLSNENLARKLGENGRSRAMAEFKWSQRARILNGLL